MEVFRAAPRQADLMIVAGRVSQKMAPVLRQIYDQMAEPKWVLAMGVCASSGGMFNNYAIVQGVDHVVPVDMYLPGCPPRPEMLIDAILKLHDQVQHAKLGANRLAEIEELEDSRPQRAADLRDEGPAALMADDARRHTRTSSPAARTDSLDTVRETSDEVVDPARRACSACSGSGDTSGYGGLVRTVAMPGATEPPYGGWFDDVATALDRGDPRPPGSRRAVEKVVVHRGEITFLVAARTCRPWRSCCATTRSCASSSAPASAGCTTPTRPAASCTRSTTCSR